MNPVQFDEERNKMKYYSIINNPPVVDFKEATIVDRRQIKVCIFRKHSAGLIKDFFSNIEIFQDEEIAFQVIKPYVGESIPETSFRQIVSRNHQFSYSTSKG